MAWGDLVLGSILTKPEFTADINALMPKGWQGTVFTEGMDKAWSHKQGFYKCAYKDSRRTEKSQR